VLTLKRAITFLERLLRDAERFGYLATRVSSGKFGFAIQLFMQQNGGWVLATDKNKQLTRRKVREIERRFTLSDLEETDGLPKGFQILGFAKTAKGRPKANSPSSKMPHDGHPGV
jgi:hypothetical protein